jgi:hypothetical protein
MIDWVMPPQTVVALYIYRVGRSCPARNPFTTRNSQGLLNSTRIRGPPVRPVRHTGQTGVAVAGSATRRPTGQTVEGHWSDQWRQPDQPCANFGCEHNGNSFMSKSYLRWWESSKQLDVQNLSGCCITIFWAIGPCILSETMGHVLGLEHNPHQVLVVLLSSHIPHSHHKQIEFCFVESLAHATSL